LQKFQRLKIILAFALKSEKQKPLSGKSKPEIFDGIVLSSLYYKRKVINNLIQNLFLTCRFLTL